MTPFAPIAFIDTWGLSSSLRSKLALFDEDDAVAIRQRDGKLTKALREWKVAALLLDKLRKLPLSGEHDFGEVAIRRLLPGEATPWLREKEWQRAYLAIVTNPLCFTFCGIAAQALPIGMLTAADASAPCCCANWGETPFFYLTAEFRRKQPSGVEEATGEAVAL